MPSGSSPNSKANLKRGNPGNRGNPLGSAMTGKEFRTTAKREATRRLHVLLGVVDNEELSPRDRLKGYEMLARYAGLDIQHVGRVDEDGELTNVYDEEALLALALATAQAARDDGR